MTNPLPEGWENMLVDPREHMSLQSLQNRRYHQEYADRVAGEILSEYYGDHDAK